LRRVRSRARVDLDLLSRCSCTVCTKKGILHLPVAPEDSELLRGKNSLTSVWQRAAAQHTSCRHCGMHAFYVPGHWRKPSADELPEEGTSPLPD
jgi:hypothetical protein